MRLTLIQRVSFYNQLLSSALNKQTNKQTSDNPIRKKHTELLTNSAPLPDISDSKALVVTAENKCLKINVAALLLQNLPSGHFRTTNQWIRNKFKCSQTRNYKSSISYSRAGQLQPNGVPPHNSQGLAYIKGEGEEIELTRTPAVTNTWFIFLLPFVKATILRSADLSYYKLCY
jgi:hypothetical protein